VTPLRAASAAVLALWSGAALGRGATPAADVLRTDHERGRAGGRLVVALRSEPKTLNPVTAVDVSSRDVLNRLHADLVHIDRETQRTVPALAKSWTVSADGRHYTLELRRGLRFSDGHPFDADDVVFSFESYLDERNGSPERDQLVVGGKPLVVRKLDPYRVVVDLEQPYGAGERLFDSIAMLPRHLLARDAEAGRLAQDWGVGAAPAAMAGLGPFRLKAYEPGERIVLEKNPEYWKVDSGGRPLPYLDEVVFLLVPSEDAQVIRFKAGETDIVGRLGAANFSLLAADPKAGRERLADLGPGLEYSFLFFNLNDLAPGTLPEVARKQAWFRQVAFRRAVSAALDRPGMVRLVYEGRATPLATHVTPGNKLWLNTAVPPPSRSLARAREILAGAGFIWKGGRLHDRDGSPVAFTIATSAGNAARVQMATIIQDDLERLGLEVQVVPLESRALLDRVTRTHDYEAALMALASGDVDPTSEMGVWLSTGPTHLWRLASSGGLAPWETEIDRLMERQLVTLDPRERKRAWDRVQELVAENLPIVPLVSPDVLVVAKGALGNFRPAVLDPTGLWNADELFWRSP
jgi:peptide/nickel transport system substrate-binding protein